MYDVIIIGGGHAGCEAALAAARIGAATLQLNLYLDNTALMPCNPSIGGAAKGHLVREISAMGGEQARAADASTLLARWLNTSKGAAVRALRAQCDPYMYAMYYTNALRNASNLHVHQDEAVEIMIENGRAVGVRTRLDSVYRAKAIVLCGGTYLRGCVHIGDKNWGSGPMGQNCARELSFSLEAAGLKLSRMRTDTTPRLKLDTIDTSELTPQGGSDGEFFDIFREFHEKAGDIPDFGAGLKFVDYSCWYGHTTKETADIIKSELHRSPLKTGQLGARGPRYCPSIEDKIMRFPEKESHPIFFEPVSMHSREVYVQNFSTSLPYDVQVRMVKTLPGCKNAEILRPGYGIEYDALPPEQLKSTLETKTISGFFCAGQINCTSGYEEAAAQGLLAGANAALKALSREDEQMTLARNEAYLGVLVDDLVTKGTDEPYRMLTSRCEHRLLLRHDNAARRLSAKAYQVGLLDEGRYSFLRSRFEAEDAEIGRLKTTRVHPSGELDSFLESKGAPAVRESLTLSDLLRRQGVTYSGICELFPPGEGKELSRESASFVETEIRYSGYIERQERMAAKLGNVDKINIPDEIYSELESIPLLSESRQKLIKFRPQTLGQASRISGVTPADVQLLAVAIEARRKRNSKMMIQEANDAGQNC
ncbi:MAG: tRNA uridine-5-carboxymethylaminomethyl(34) synthesis enzyme MnmG [Synergistaceae bacterium]|nr:tRNA uridine-5-carboxymethylaminomethyl(34) synthesis enzyme MnmG [Synergistaceae bacterium]